MTKKWIQKALKGRKSGAFHRQLGVPVDQKIPEYLLTEIINTPVGERLLRIGSEKNRIKVTKLMKKRANLLLNMDRSNR